MKKHIFLLLVVPLITVSCMKSLTFNDYLQQGEHFLKEKNYDNARKSYSEAIKMNPKSYLCYLKRGISEIYLSENDKAQEDIAMANSLNPGFNSDLQKLFKEYFSVYINYDPKNVIQRQPLLLNIMKYDTDLIGVALQDFEKNDYEEFMEDYLRLYAGANIEQLSSLLKYDNAIELSKIDLNNNSDCILVGSGGTGLFDSYFIFIEFDGKLQSFNTGSYNCSTRFMSAYSIANQKEKAAIFSFCIRNGEYLENLGILTLSNSKYEYKTFCTDCGFGDVKTVDLDKDGDKEIVCLKAAENDPPMVQFLYNFPFIFKWSGTEMVDKTFDYPDYLIQHYSKMLNVKDENGRFIKNEMHRYRMDTIDKYIINLSDKHKDFYNKKLKPLKDKYFGIN